ncbi:MAG: BT4734/BF3469 family protein [Flammeovirgaceae bacterium]
MQPIQKETILDSTNGGLDVFRHYIGDFPIKKAFKSPLREEKKASFSIFEKGGIYYFKDNGTDQKGDCFSYVMEANGCDFKQAIEHIVTALNITSNGSAVTPKPKPQKQVVTDTSNSVSLFETARHKKVAENTSIYDILAGIKSGKWIKQVSAYRKLYFDGQLDEAKKLKIKLPAFTYAGTFAKRADDAMLTKSNVVIIDIDVKRKELDTDQAMDQLKKCPYVYGYFASPSLGLKVVLKAAFPAHEVEFRDYYEQACKDLSEHTGIPLAVRITPDEGKPYWTDGIDPVNKNLSRLCFVSYDPESFTNEQAILYRPDLELEEEVKEQPPIFWYEQIVSSKWQLVIDRDHYLKFLIKNGFCVRHIADEKYEYLQVIDNIIYQRTMKQVKSFVLDYVTNFPIDYMLEMQDDDGTSIFNQEWTNKQLRDMILASKKIFNNDIMHFLEEKKLNLKKDTPHESFYFYQNCWVKVTKRGITPYSYKVLDGLVFKKKILNRNFKLTSQFLIKNDKGHLIPNHEFKHDFKEFIFNVTGKDIQRFKTFCSAIGYLLHGWKDPAYYKFVLLMDEAAEIGGRRKGRTGKGRLEDALFYMKNTEMAMNIALHQDGSKYDETYSFSIQGLDHETELVKMEDMKEGFPITDLIVYLSGSTFLNQKNRAPLFLRYDESPKWFGSTNFILKEDDDSMADRIFELEFSDYYNLKHRPVDDFKKMFFIQWNDQEWNQFDTFMLGCIQYFLYRGKRIVDYQRDNIKNKRFLMKTKDLFKGRYKELDMSELILYFHGLKAGEVYEKKELYNKFIEVNQPYNEVGFSQTTFSRSLTIFAEYKGFIISHPHTTKIELLEASSIRSKFNESLWRFIDSLIPNTYPVKELCNQFKQRFAASFTNSDFVESLKKKMDAEGSKDHNFKNHTSFTDGSFSMLRIYQPD